MIRIYSRVSSKTQDSRGQDSELRRWSEGKQATWYKDAFTGRTMSRPAWDRLVEDLRAGDTLVCWRLDRLGRTAAGLSKLFEQLQVLKVNLVSLKDSVDLSTASGRLLAHVIASVASYETEIRSERQLVGIQAARAAGKTWGGSAKGRRLSVSEEQVAQIRRLKSEGMRVSSIARAVGVTRSTVYRLLGES